MAKSKGFTVEQKAEMRAAYEQGDILKTIATKWGVAVPTMSNYIRQAGGTLRNAGTPKKVQDVVFTTGTETLPTFEVVTGVLPVSETKSNFTPAVPEVVTQQAPVARRILPFE
jgi:transposase-like protein